MDIKPHILTESILDDEELQDSYRDRIDIDNLMGEVDADPSDYEFYANVRYTYNKLYKEETTWWRKEFTAHINVLDIYEDVHRIATLSGLFKTFFISPKVTMLGYSDCRMTHINKTWEYPELPDDFDVKAWYEDVEKKYPRNVIASHQKEAIFCLRIYFNFDKQMSHKQFLKRLWKFLPGMNILKHTPKDHSCVLFFRNDSEPDDRLELALVRDTSHPEDPESFSANYMYTPEQFDALYTALSGRDDYQQDSGRLHNYVQEKIIDSVNFPKLMRYAAAQAKEKYGIILTPGSYQYPDKFSVYQRNLSSTSSWCAFTVENADKSKKEIDVYELEECIIDCLLYRMSVHYFGICEFAVILRVIPKLVNRKSEEIRQQFIKVHTSAYSNRIPNMTQDDKEFHHFDNTMRPVDSGDVRMDNNQWNERVRKVGINSEEVIIMMADKNGRLTRNLNRMQYPAERHNYLVDLMASDESIWLKNKKRVHKLTESLLDDIRTEDIPDAKNVL